jgi:hypothetical protein
MVKKGKKPKKIQDVRKRNYFSEEEENDDALPVEDEALQDLSDDDSPRAEDCQEDEDDLV